MHLCTWMEMSTELTSGYQPLRMESLGTGLGCSEVCTLPSPSLTADSVWGWGWTPGSRACAALGHRSELLLISAF